MLEFFPNCDAWDVTPVDGGRLQDPQGDVPVLVLSGGLDPIVPTSFVDEVRAQFPNTTVVSSPPAATSSTDTTTASARSASPSPLTRPHPSTRPARPTCPTIRTPQRIGRSSIRAVQRGLDGSRDRDQSGVPLRRGRNRFPRALARRYVVGVRESCRRSVRCPDDTPRFGDLHQEHSRSGSPRVGLGQRHTCRSASTLTSVGTRDGARARLSDTSGIAAHGEHRTTRTNDDLRSEATRTYRHLGSGGYPAVQDGADRDTRRCYRLLGGWRRSGCHARRWSGFLTARWAEGLAVVLDRSRQCPTRRPAGAPAPGLQRLDGIEWRTTCVSISGAPCQRRSLAPRVGHKQPTGGSRHAARSRSRGEEAHPCLPALRPSTR